MNMTESLTGAVTVLDIEGRLDATTAPLFKARINELVEAGRIYFVVNLSRIHFLDSSGLGLLVSSLRQVGQKGGDIKIAALKAEMKPLFTLTRLNKVFDIYETQETALNSFAS